MEWNGKGYDINNNIIYEIKNGKGYVKEYDNNGKLQFEGEYLYGKRNGKGKLYSNGWYEHYLKFEGEYLNDKKNGKGKEYNKHGELIFEGEYFNGKKNRKGKEYYIDDEGYNGKLKFEGEYIFGKRNKGKEYSKDYYVNLEEIDNANKEEYKENERHEVKKKECFLI